MAINEPQPAVPNGVLWIIGAVFFLLLYNEVRVDRRSLIDVKPPALK